MLPVVNHIGIQQIGQALGRMGQLSYGGAEALKQRIPTKLGDLVLTMTDLGGLRNLQEDMATHLARRGMLTANPQALKMIRDMGPKLRGISVVDVAWPDAIPGKSMVAPTEGVGTGTSLGLVKAVRDAYKDQVIPTVTRLNPDAISLVSNAPTSLSRANLYQSMGLMGPVDPLGNQYSLIYPDRRIQPLELFGGGLPPYMTKN